MNNIKTDSLRGRLELARAVKAEKAAKRLADYKIKNEGLLIKDEEGRESIDDDDTQSIIMSDGNRSQSPTNSASQNQQPNKQDSI